MEYKVILLVDDSATSRMIIKRCFEMSGFQDSSFLEAEDGLRAMSYLKRERVDLIVTDLNMPKMDGSTFIKKLKLLEETRELPVVVISSMGNEQMEKELQEENVMGIIHKPISPEKVIEVFGG
jgi:CheY-like chemotaxis protein